MTAYRPASRHVHANGIDIHYLRDGEGPPLLLLHGWPEFSDVWLRCMARLRDRFDLIAPDLRGFGRSEKPDAGPSDRAGADVHAEDVRDLMTALGIVRAGLVGHDVGAYVMQAFARKYPQRLSGLFFFNCPTPGIGKRWSAAGHLRETWYQNFHQQPFAAALVGSSREACRLYLQHFLQHWAADPHAFDDDLDAWVDNFMRPGNLQGGFNWYISANAARLAVIRGEAPALPRIATPARVLWGAKDPILKADWADCLGETFAHVKIETVADAGHFVHYESPDRAAAEIARFFAPMT